MTVPFDVDAVMPDLTLDEKISLIAGVNSWNTVAIDRLGIPALVITDGPHGVRRVKGGGGGAFGIAENVPATSFPTASAVASSWNLDNARRIGEAIGTEARTQGVHVLLAPGINIVRDPRCGRTFEYYSEDPLLSGTLGAAFVAGVESRGVATSVKHFAANSNENYRFVGNSVVDERAMHEIYLRAFERIVTREKPATVMAAYNQFDGTFCSENPELLRETLRQQWGFDGVVMSDWGATHDRAAGLAAGLDLDMPGGVPHNAETVKRAIAEGTLSVAALDSAVRNILTLIAKYHHGAVEEPADEQAHAALAAQVAMESAVLLHNDGTLPLSSEQRILVVGEMFEHLRFQGAGSSLVTPTSVTSARDAFTARGIDYAYARGYRALDANPDEKLIREACEGAADADVILFFGGLTDMEESEGFDRDDLRLGAAQRELLTRLVATEVPVVFVLHTGSVVEVPHVDKLAAVLNMGLAGMRSGEAAAALVLGEANPSGKLAISWPRAVSDLSAYDDFNRSAVAQYYESIYVGYRYYDAADTELQFPFGFGLSYTSFSYDELSVSVDNDEVTAAVTITNQGSRDGAEVVQLYVRNNTTGTFKAVKELRAFDKVFIEAGSQRRVTLTFGLQDLAHWDVAEHAWVLDNGTYEVLIASSARDVRLRADLTVTTGREPRSSYGPAIERAYARPPRVVPPEFASLVGAEIPHPASSRRLTMETRLIDARRSLIGAVVYRAVIGRVSREYRAARALAPSLERDARIKNSYFLLRMMPMSSMRSLVQSSNGMFPYWLAAGLADIAAWHPIRGLRRILTRR